jgi:pyroglutamyl-peptidase
MKVLVTGFEPFAGDNVNPSWEAVQRLVWSTDRIELARLQVPATYSGSIPTVTGAIERLHPDVVLMVGQAGGRAELSVERLAINMDDAPAADNEGKRIEGIPVVEGGPPAYFATIPVEEVVEILHKSHVPVVMSNSAGTFVCNHLMYGVLHYIAAKRLGTTAGFIHVPFLPEQVVTKPGTPSMALEFVVQALTFLLPGVEPRKPFR